MESIVVDASAYVGLAATIALTLNYMFGMMIGTAYRRAAYWKRLPERLKGIHIYNWHNRTAYIAIALVLIHPLLLLADRSTKFHFLDIIFPIHAPTQKLFVALGTVAMFAFLLVLLTSQKGIRKRLTFRNWKNIHLISYGTALLFIFHGLLIDPELKNRSVDILDGEKLVSVACLLLIISTTVFRVRYEITRRKANHKKMRIQYKSV